MLWMVVGGKGGEGRVEFVWSQNRFWHSDERDVIAVFAVRLKARDILTWIWNVRTIPDTVVAHRVRLYD